MKLKLSPRWLFTAALLLIGPNCVFAQTSTTKVTVEVSNIVDVKANGQVDWSKEEIRAVGIGLAPAFATTPAQIKVYAREAAIGVAERNLLKVISGIQITSETTVENLMLKNDTIKTKLEGMLQGAVIVSEKQMPDNSYEVVMAVQMYGKKGSLSQSINLADQFKAANPDVKIISPVAVPPIVEPPIVVPPIVEPPIAVPPIVEPPIVVPPIVNPPIVVPPVVEPPTALITKGYTGLIIDCRGMGLSRSQCPRILDQNNSNIWSNLKVSSEVVNEKGIAGYYLSGNDPTIAARVGKNPLKITALRATGRNIFKTDAVISPANAELIRAENAKTMFLEKLNVAFLTDK